MNQQAIEQELAAHRERIDGIEQILAQVGRDMSQFLSGMLAIQANLDPILPNALQAGNDLWGRRACSR